MSVNKDYDTTGKRFTYRIHQPMSNGDKVFNQVVDALNRIDGVTCVELQVDYQPPSTLIELILHTDPSGVRGMMNVYEHLLLRKPIDPNSIISFQVVNLKEVVIAVRLFNDQGMGEDLATLWLNTLLEATTTHFHEVISNIIEKRRRSTDRHLHLTRS